MPNPTGLEGSGQQQGHSSVYDPRHRRSDHVFDPTRTNPDSAGLWTAMRCRSSVGISGNPCRVLHQADPDGPTEGSVHDPGLLVRCLDRLRDRRAAGEGQGRVSTGADRRIARLRQLVHGSPEAAQCQRRRCPSRGRSVRVGLLRHGVRQAGLRKDCP
uniref:(northern house mosquito) hypothetical protein n=1 Tax=Culex pipiens TaxID=7175 RepID=A0A8D8BN98_CULPI